MLFGSVMPRSTLIPGRSSVIYAPCPSPRMNAAAPVTVHCEVGVLIPPYSTGKRNCLSAEQLWDEVTTAALPISVELSQSVARISPSAEVEHAP
ncbi:unknown [Candidatus Colimorpha enterica]|uniref:Uncharacterized protein n=1 Tax=Candidatus Colimorpha enterica TaxID=3083063 RepID=R6UNH5_9BACT|nr:unknown [Candidatus Colimorpha enterica]